MKDVPEVLNAITDVVLAYRPKPRTKAALKRKRLKNGTQMQAPTARSKSDRSTK